MVCFDGSNTLVLGGYKFSKLNRRKGILVTSVDPVDSTQSIVISSNESSIMNNSNPGKEDGQVRMRRRKSEKSKESELEKKAFLFCKLVDRILLEQNSSCFVGYEVIYKMVSSGLAEDRAEALALGKDLSKKLRLFYRVEFKRNTFSDDGKTYQFRPEVLLSVITKSPMTIKKFAPLDNPKKNERLESKTSHASDLTFSPIVFRKFAPKNNFSEEKKEEEIRVERNSEGKPMKKGRRPKANQGIDQMRVIPQDQYVSSKDDRAQSYGEKNLTTTVSIHECEDDENSVYTEVTVSEHNTLRSVPTFPMHDDDDDSYMEFTVSTSGGEENIQERSTHSYFDEYTLGDEDEYDSMPVLSTPVVTNVEVEMKPNVIPVNMFLSPNDVTGFDNMGSRRSVKAFQEHSLNSRIRRGELDIEVPDLGEVAEDAYICDC